MSAIIQNIIFKECCSDEEFAISVMNGYDSETDQVLELSLGEVYKSNEDDICFEVINIIETFDFPEEGYPPEITYETFISNATLITGGCESSECESCEEPEPEPESESCFEPINDLCVNLSITHPDIGEQEIFDVIAVNQEILFNNKPVYKITLTSLQHSILGLVLEFYFVWHNNTWGVWPEFDINTGPSNNICNNNNLPLIILEKSEFAPPGIVCEEPITIGAECNYGTSNIGYDSAVNCDYYIDGIRSVEFCPRPKNVRYFKVENCLNPDINFVIETEPSFIYNIGHVVSFEFNEESYFVNCWKIVKELFDYDGTVKCFPIIDCYNSCESCLPKCKCTRIKNLSSNKRKFKYLDCNGDLQETSEQIPAGKTSKKYCVLKSISNEVEVINFGNCKDNECPEVPRPKKFVSPGYNTPICSPENYERIVCRYSENKYKEAINKRYGIENCCSDDSIQNDIKYELIHLQILKDPNYQCVNELNPCDSGYGYISLNRSNFCNNNNESKNNQENNNDDHDFEKAKLSRPNILK